ncbi:uncharacterized protein K452DRAFT_221246 [Aplosporella prunicola CBS 121167]|uniref:PXA domain-containing protein n=1 Tax=Aplosporella prunicola CBS 121167 TaxID=1176127 RepID=A0A6A6BR03_9PEZI|nr:uncharacterized protein K452DRAFT_221246 [Aplosporella prunicola CBS 121167]KAF2145735.1 hypothetical protein K452DRAFT_221246 [Aplosporella prunicola CBS 121167]
MELTRRDVILACVAVFVAWGFVTNWLPSLRYFPHAFIAGIAVSIAAFGYLALSTSRGHDSHLRRYKRTTPRLAFITAPKWSQEINSLNNRLLYRREPLYPPSFVISDHLDGLLDLLLRDFVASWYGSISGRPTFINEVDRAIRAALDNIRDRLLAVDLVEIVIARAVPLVTAHMRDFYEAERIVRGRKLSRDVTESEELDLAIAGKYRDGKLHPAASLTYTNTKVVQQQHLRSIVARLMAQVLPRNMRTSSAVNTLIKEIVACAVLFPVMQMLSDPDTWNQLLEGYGRTLLQDRKTVRKLRAALDEHAPSSPSTTTFPRLAPHDSERRFERFIRSMRQCNSLTDARRFRNEIASQLKKDAAVEGQDPLYLRRLETAKRILDQRVAHLSSGGAAKQKAAPQTPGSLIRSDSRVETANLRQVLYDSSGLSYFMEFMDRQGLMRLVQFWIVVDGFRNPLEEDTDEPEDDAGFKHSWGSSERADLAQIYEAYITKPELAVPGETRRMVSEFLNAGRAATSSQYLAARRAVLQVQTSVYHVMQERHFPKFKRSDLFFKWLASDEASSIAKSPLNGPERSVTVPASSASLARPPNLSRTSSTKSTLLGPDLRRAAVSSSDLKNVKTAEVAAPARRSLDDGGRAPLFDDDYDTDPLARSTQSFDSEMDIARANGDNSQIVDAMQAALNDIMDAEPDRDSLFSDSGPRSIQDTDSLRGSLEISRSTSPNHSKRDKERPNIASLGLVGVPSNRGVFTDNLFGDEEKFLEDELEDSDTNGKDEEDQIHEAAPGDLGLAEAIDALSQEIDRLVNQESIVDSLTRKAELTNNAAELRILKKSKASLQREIHRKELQRQQYVVQESDNSLYGRATISIQSIMVGNDEDGREFAMYVIEVRRQAGEHMPAAAWVVARRYSEFHELNKRLRAQYPMVRNLDFPRRQMVLKLQKDFLQKRRVALERYLRELLLIPAICRSRELRAFLSQQTISSSDPTNPQADTRDFVARIYSSVTDGMEEFLGNIPVLDQLSLAGQNLISAATNQLNNAGPLGNGGNSALSNDPQTAAEAEAELRAYESRELEPFIKPICDLFLELFELNRENNWLRGRAVVVVLHQLLGGTIERKTRENVKIFTQEDNMARYISMIKDKMWPGGGPRPQAVPRTPAEKARSQKEAGLLLATLIPDLAGSVVGRANAQAASRRILATLNNQRLNTHLVFTLMDEVLQVIFGA